MLFGVLLADAATLPRTGDLTVFTSLFTARSTGPRFVEEFYIFRDEEGMHFVDPYLESWGELATTLHITDQSVLACGFRHKTWRLGIWSHTREREFKGLLFVPLSGEWGQDDYAEVRTFLTQCLNEGLPTSEVLSEHQDVINNSVEHTRILWLGVAHDAFALLIFTALLYSFTGWPAWFAAHPWSRRNRRRLRGLCPECGYDTRGLTTCPECGATCDQSPE